MLHVFLIEFHTFLATLKQQTRELFREGNCCWKRCEHGLSRLAPFYIEATSIVININDIKTLCHICIFHYIKGLDEIFSDKRQNGVCFEFPLKCTGCDGTRAHLSRQSSFVNLNFDEIFILSIFIKLKRSVDNCGRDKKWLTKCWINQPVDGTPFDKRSCM